MAVAVAVLPSPARVEGSERGGRSDAADPQVSLARCPALLLPPPRRLPGFPSADGRPKERASRRALPSAAPRHLRLPRAAPVTPLSRRRRFLRDGGWRGGGSGAAAEIRTGGMRGGEGRGGWADLTHGPPPYHADRGSGDPAAPGACRAGRARRGFIHSRRLRIASRRAGSSPEGAPSPPRRLPTPSLHPFFCLPCKVREPPLSCPPVPPSPPMLYRRSSIFGGFLVSPGSPPPAKKQKKGVGGREREDGCAVALRGVRG